MSKLDRDLSLSAQIEKADSAILTPSSLDGTRNSTSGKTRNILAAGALLAATALVGGKAEAQEIKDPCFFSMNGKKQDNVTIHADDKKTASWAVITGAKGELQVSDGVVNDGFEKGVCLGGADSECGRWTAHKDYSAPGVYKENIKVVGGECEGASHDFTVTVEAPAPVTEPVLTIEDPSEAHITIAEKEAYDEHLGETADGEHRMDIGAGVYVGPNVDTTTSVEIGPYVYFLAKPGTKYFNIGAELQWSRTGQPIWEPLKPQNTASVDEDFYTASITGGPTLPISAGADFDWLEFYARGSAGITIVHHGQENIGDDPVVSHGQEDIGDERVVSADTRVLPVLGATLGVSLCPTPNFCFDASGRVQVEAGLRPTDAGTEGQHNAPESVPHGKGGVNLGLKGSFEAL